jgi:hypothetical protein
MGTGGSAGGPSCVPTSDTETNCSGGGDDDCDGFVDCLDPECEGKSCGSNVTCLAGACLGKGPLPELPRIDNVVPTVRGDSAIVDFSPVLGAKDYRIYTLPAEADVLVGQNGEVAVRNAVYRCGGALPREDRANSAMKQMFPLSLAGNIHGYQRSEAESVIGYVYLTPGPGRTAVYRVANPNSMGGYTWEYDAVPAKEYNGADYVEGAAARDALLAKGWRDDGIAFYVSSTGTRPVYRREYTEGFVFFYTDGPEKTVRDKVSAAQGGERFKVLATAADGAVPLYRIHYGWHNDHDNLAAGDANKERVLHQFQSPVTSLMWSGLKGPTTLVVEALDAGCPFPGGYIGARSAPKVTQDSTDYPTITLDAARLSSGEVFVNGQFDPTNRPKPIARAYVTVEPKPHPQMDWFESFDEGKSLGPVKTLVSDGNGTRVFHTDRLSVEYMVSNENYAYGPVLGQLFAGSLHSWSVAPLAAGARLESDAYLHVTMAVDLASTGRRYPQIWITDTPLGDPARDASNNLPFIRRLGPVPFEMLPPGQYHTIIAQTFGGSPALEIQFCDQRGWGVSQQCPRANIYGYPAGDSNYDGTDKWLPLPVPAEYAGMDRLVKWDLYASTQRVYLFIEDRPAGCAVLPQGKMPAGPVNVIFSIAGYHIEIDEFVAPADSRHQYWRRFSLAHTDRKMDDLGIKNGAALPAWNESIMPCGTRFYGE